jgi:hypothetical protein
VADIVAACSDTFEDPKPPWRERKEAYLAKLRDHRDEAAFLVSLADKVHNCRAIVRDVRSHGSEVWNRFNAPPADILWYYESVLAILAQKLPGSLLVPELRDVVIRLRGLVTPPEEGRSES